MTETDAYLQLIIMMSVLILLPFIYKVFFALGRLLVVKFFPAKYLTIEVKRLDGSACTQMVDMKNNQELVDLLLARGTIHSSKTKISN